MTIFVSLDEKTSSEAGKLVSVYPSDLKGEEGNLRFQKEDLSNNQA